MIVNIDGEPYGGAAYLGDAGVDLRYAGEDDVWITPGSRALLETGAYVEIGSLDGGVGLVAPRSGLAWKKGLTVLNSPGIVDSGYTGEILVNLANMSDEAVVIMPGDRIAQYVEVRLYGVDGEAAGTERGERGHGSSGV